MHAEGREIWCDAVGRIGWMHRTPPPTHTHAHTRHDSVAVWHACMHACMGRARCCCCAHVQRPQVNWPSLHLLIIAEAAPMHPPALRHEG